MVRVDQFQNSRSAPMEAIRVIRTTQIHTAQKLLQIRLCLLRHFIPSTSKSAISKMQPIFSWHTAGFTLRLQCFCSAVKPNISVRMILRMKFCDLLCSLAILRGDKTAPDSQFHISHYKDVSRNSSMMVDSRKTLPGSVSFSDDINHLGSRSNSLAHSSSFGTYPSRASDYSADSRRSLHPSTSYGSSAGDAMRTSRSSQNMAGTIFHGPSISLQIAQSKEMYKTRPQKVSKGFFSYLHDVALGSSYK